MTTMMKTRRTRWTWMESDGVGGGWKSTCKDRMAQVVYDISTSAWCCDLSLPAAIPPLALVHSTRMHIIINTQHPSFPSSPLLLRLHSVPFHSIPPYPHSTSLAWSDLAHLRCHINRLSEYIAEASAETGRDLVLGVICTLGREGMS